MAKNVYVVNGEDEVTTIKEVIEILGRKVTKKEILEGEVEEVEFFADTEELDEEVEDEYTEEEDTEEEDTEEVEDDSIDDNDVPDTEEDTEEIDEEEVDTEEDTTEKPSMDELLAKLRENNAKIAETNPESVGGKKKTKVDLQLDEEGNVVYPEKGYFKTEKDIKKYYKQLSEEQLDEWLEIEGLEYKPNDNEGINRMRKCMAILNFHFPKESKGKKKSPYAKYSTEELIEMALDNNIEVQDAKGDLRILRMYAIVALKKAGILK